MSLLPDSLIPDCSVHGVWVRSNTHDMFGRLCYKVSNRYAPGSIEFMVQWEIDADVGFKSKTGSYELPEDLEVRPYQPKPWYKGAVVEEVVYSSMTHEWVTEQPPFREGARVW